MNPKNFRSAHDTEASIRKRMESLRRGIEEEQRVGSEAYWSRQVKQWRETSGTK